MRVLSIHVLLQNGERRDVAGIEVAQGGYVNLVAPGGEIAVVEAKDIRAVDVRVVEQ